MNMKEYRYSAYAGLMIGLMVGLLLTTTGCMTKYTIEKHAQDGSSIVINVQSFREFEQPEVTYSKSTDEVKFSFGAESATTATSPIEEAMAEILVKGGSIGATVMTPLLSPGKTE